MDKVSAYLEIIPLPVLFIALAFAVVGFLAIPTRWRLPTTIVTMVVVLAVGRFPDLGVVAYGAKVTGFAAFTAIIVAAYLDDVPRARLSPLAWAYIVLVAYGFLFIITVTDLVLALALQVQFGLLCLAAIMVARTVRDERSLMRVLWSLWVGLAIANLICFAHLLLRPGEALRAGLDRFEPWGANSNQSGVLFSALAPLSVYLALRMRGVGGLVWQVMLFGFAALAFGMGLLSGSRSTMATMIIAGLPLGLVLGRRVVVGVVAVGLLAVGALFIISQVEGNALERFQSVETGRVETGAYYLSEVIAERPITGLLGTTGQSFLRDEGEIGQHPHNAYLELAYVGGAVYLGPYLLMAGLTGLSTFAIWRTRKTLHADPLLISYLSFQMLALYAHGMVNGAIYYPTYDWAFMHIFISCLFLSAAHRRKMGEDAFAPQEYHEQWLLDVDAASGYADPRPAT